MDKRIGAQYYTIREYIQDEKGFDESCKKIKDIGYKIVQLSGVGPIEPQKIREILDKYSLEAVCSHRGADDYLKTIDNTIEWHKITGCKIAGLGYLIEVLGGENLDRFIKTYNGVAERLAKDDITFAVHNHQFEFEKIKGKYIFDIIAENTNPDCFKFILDVYWLAFAGINPADFIEKYKGRIAAVHFKDLGIKGTEPKYVEIGQGNLDWDSIIKACENADVEYALVEQDVCDGNPFDSLKTSYDFLTKKSFN